jgi:signal transduction histidine kinase
LLYFLAALAAVLIGFSLTLYGLMRTHLYAQLDERLEAAMTALVAAVEVHPRDVQWEPLERQLVVGDDSWADGLRWTLHDLSGRLRDRSQGAADTVNGADAADGGWRVLVRRMRAGKFLPEAIDGGEAPSRMASLANTPIGAAATTSLPTDRTFDTDGIILTVAVNEASVEAMLRWLALVLFSVSATTWITGALWGRWLCSRALRPIVVMATSARAIRQQPETMQMLDVPATRDELGDLGQAFNDLLGDLRESLDRQRQFAGDASHQLRTPLTAMLTSVDVALRQERSPADYQRVLELVQRRGGQLRQIIESLLFLARAGGAAALDPPTQIDLNEWCRSWFDAWAEHPRSADFRFQPSPRSATVATHPALLGQVLDNLLDNASKYSEPGTPINVAIETTPDHVRIVVSDKGSGIAADQQPLIFEPFYRSAEARWQGTAGVGLGLALVRRLAEILGAQVKVASVVNQGSSFTITLPVCAMLEGQER